MSIITSAFQKVQAFNFTEYETSSKRKAAGPVNLGSVGRGRTLPRRPEVTPGPITNINYAKHLNVNEVNVSRVRD